MLSKHITLPGKDVPGLAYIILLGLTILSGKDVPEFTCIILLGLILYCLVKTCLD